MEINIRILEQSDTKIYQTARLRALQTNPEAYSSTFEKEVNYSLETVAERMKPSVGKFVLGAFDDRGSLVGNVAFVRENGLKTAHKGNVYAMYVAPEMREQGVGKSLMLELVRRARLCEGLEQINLSVMSDNEPAIKLYTSLGFVVYGVEHNALKYKGRYFDEDFMVLKIG